MTMKDIFIRSSASDCIDGPESEELFEFSQTGQDCRHDPYRCPVSTPAGYERVQDRERNNSYLSFTSLNRSFEIPRNLSVFKQLTHRSAKYNRLVTKPQKKNFDCYFVNKAERVPVENGPTWLTSLCSQPVEEIFNKYKRQSEAKFLSHRNSAKSRNVSTPGEKALVFAWTSNTSQRESPSMTSRSSCKTDPARRSQRPDPPLHGYGYDADQAKLRASLGFALMPVSYPAFEEMDDITWSSVGSLYSHRACKPSTTTTSVQSASPSGANVYEPYQRQKKFPTIRRKKSLSPTKKRIQSDPIKHATSLPLGINQLEESPIEIISVGSFTKQEDSVETLKPAVPANSTKPICSYRLPKNPPSSLPELKGNG